MNKLILITAFLISITLSAVSPIKDFAAWKAVFKGKYSPQQQTFRRGVFEKNILKIKSHNADKTQTYQMGVNQFTVLTDAEFQLLYLSGIKVDQKQKVKETTITPIVNAVVQIDWTSKARVTSVRNQGSCGSCWSFAAVAVLQSFNLIVKKVSLDLSEQQLVDCSSSYGNQGCNGGWPASALNYVRDFGITTEALYPYTAVNQACKITGGNFKIKSVNSASGCTGLRSTILTSPIAVAVDATNWNYYNKGIFSNCKSNINHAVLLVGIVSGNWKIKNSWGTRWGQNGYMRLAPGNTCGICNYAGTWVK